MNSNIVTWTDSIVISTLLIFTIYFAFRPQIKTHNPKHPLLKTLLAVVLYTCIYKPVDVIFSNYYIFMLSLFLAGILYSVFMVKSSIKETILLLTVFIYSTVCIKSVVLSTTENIFSAVSVNTLIQSAVSYGIQDLLLVLVSIFFIKHPLAESNHLPVKYWVLMLSVPIILAFFIQYHINDSIVNNYAFNPNFLYMILAAFVLELLIYYIAYIFTITYEQLYSASLMNQKLSLQSDYMHRSEETMKQIRAEKHELKNHYFYLQALARNKQYEELETFLSSEISERLNFLDEYHTGNTLLDYLLTQKVAEARQAGIETVTDISITPDLPISEEDLYTVICNLVDNAIDAEKKEANPKITIQMNIVKGCLHIAVRNRTGRDILSENPSLNTSKANPEYHGIGLKLVKKITEKYNGDLNFTYADGWFEASCILMIGTGH